MLSCKSDGGPQKDPLMLVIVISLYFHASSLFVLTVLKMIKYNIIAMLSISGPFSGPPSLSQELIHMVYKLQTLAHNIIIIMKIDILNGNHW